MSNHSKLPPSSAARRGECPGSRALESQYPNGHDTPEAEEGALAHLLASETLEDTGKQLPTDLITQEMVDGSNLYCKTIKNKLTEKSARIHVDFNTLPKQIYGIEERVDISIVHPDCWGTVDCWFVLDRELFIFDYKYGFKFVEVFENWQLLEYAAGILDAFGALKQESIITKINFCIVQPRSYHRDGQVRWWHLATEDFLPYLNILRDAEMRATEPNARCYPNPECTYCTARHACPTLQNAALSAVDVSYQNTSNQLLPMATGSELRYLKRAAKLLEARITGLEEQATYYLKRGEQVAHFKLEPGKSHPRWNVSAAEIITMGQLMSVDLAKPPAVVTPLQALDAGLDESIMNRYSERFPAAMKLVEDDGVKARKIFGGKANG
jgi:hypothetical protein